MSSFNVTSSHRPAGEWPSVIGVMLSCLLCEWLSCSSFAISGETPSRASEARIFFVCRALNLFVLEKTPPEQMRTILPILPPSETCHVCVWLLFVIVALSVHIRTAHRQTCLCCWSSQQTGWSWRAGATRNITYSSMNSIGRPQVCVVLFSSHSSVLLPSAAAIRVSAAIATFRSPLTIQCSCCASGQARLQRS